MRILAWLMHTFLNPLGMALGFLIGLLARRAWQAAVAGAIVGAATVLIVAHLHQASIQERPTVTGAIVCGAWAWLAYRLRRWLHPPKSPQ